MGVSEIFKPFPLIHLMWPVFVSKLDNFLMPSDSSSLLWASSSSQLLSPCPGINERALNAPNPWATMSCQHFGVIAQFLEQQASPFLLGPWWWGESGGRDHDPCYLNVVHEPAALALPESSLEMQNPDLLNQSLHFLQDTKRFICIVKFAKHAPEPTVLLPSQVRSWALSHLSTYFESDIPE